MRSKSRPWLAVIVALMVSPLSGGEARAQSAPAPDPPGAPARSYRSLAYDPEPTFWTGQRTAGFVVGLVGIAGVLVGSGFGLASKDARDRSFEDGHCVGNRCDFVGFDRQREALSLGSVSTGFFIGGLALAGAGAALFFTVTSDEPARPVTRARLTLGPSGAMLQGAW